MSGNGRSCRKANDMWVGCPDIPETTRSLTLSSRYAYARTRAEITHNCHVRWTLPLPQAAICCLAILTPGQYHWLAGIYMISCGYDSSLILIVSTRSCNIMEILFYEPAEGSLAYPAIIVSISHIIIRPTQQCRFHIILVIWMFCLRLEPNSLSCFQFFSYGMNMNNSNSWQKCLISCQTKQHSSLEAKVSGQWMLGYTVLYFVIFKLLACVFHSSCLL